ncbi:MAG TPA: TonB-dependent receptor [Chryseolinea sp.]|jgi:TonB-linked SusC/RagA family outer membrane protein|nr:TonB-dependent receptor [Chryseolinea sp.]
MKRLLLMVLVPILFSVTAWGQAEKVVTGKVTSSDDSGPLPGVNVVVQGTAKGVTTDAEGNYSIQLAPAENTLVFTFVGYKTTTVDVTNKTTADVILEGDVTSLEEVVVVGYGTQREKDLTSAISTIKTEDIVRTPTGQAMQSLQGKVPGLQIVSSGQPGASPTVRVRGLGSYPRTDVVTGAPLGTEAPLYVVDGMFFDNIDFLNTADIASISVLKDASAAAIYGVRAANGVILIETKTGKFKQKAQITYDGYYGVQVAQNVLKMANSEQFTNMALESGSPSDIANIDAAMQRYGRSRVNPNVPDVNTDWYEEVIRTAPIQNHTLGVTGGGDNTTYSIGASYFNQDGIMDMPNSFERFTMRSRIDYQANDWLKIGGNVNISNALKTGQDEVVAQNAEAWKVAYFAVPIMPVYDYENEAAYPVKYSSAELIGYRDGKNPLPIMDFNRNQTRQRRVLSNFYVKVDLLPDKLSFQTTYNLGATFQNDRNVDLPYFLTNDAKNLISAIVKKNETTYNQIWDNVLTYNQDFGNHYLTVMAGASFRDESWDMLKARGEDLLTPFQEKSWYLRQANTIKTEDVDDDAARNYGMSYFGRVAYNFNDKYLLYGTMRADGTSKYQEKWGYFPSVGAGWVISEEEFMANIGALDFLKFRASWGRLGNDKITPQTGAVTQRVVTTAINGTLVTGTVKEPFGSLTWEVTEEWNVGLTTRILNDRLSIEADYYVRDTEDLAIPVRTITGDTYLRSVGIVRNSGFELALNWTESLGSGFSYNIGANLATLKNETRDLYGQPYIDGGTAEFQQRTRVGDPLFAFFGYETVGVYQNDAQIEADPVAVALNAATPGAIVPGDFIFKDNDGDGAITGEDRVILGSYLPTFTYGVNLGASYKNFDLAVNLMGQTGNQILNRKRGEMIWTPDGNMDADLAINRWHGEGTSNKYPSSAGLRKGWNQKMSNYFVEDGGFFRIQNVTLAYNLRGTTLGDQWPDARIFVTAERPLTVFDYNGFNPEIPNGVDTQTYPIPAIYTVGLNVKF